LIELVVVTGVIGLLIALLMPAIQQSREAARRVQCRNNLKQIGLALHNYHDTHRVFPPGAGTKPGATDQFTDFEWRATGFVMILPYLDQQPLHATYNFNCGTGGCIESATLAQPQAKFLLNAKLSVYRCPSGIEVFIEPRDGHLDRANGGATYGSSYVFNSGRKYNTGSTSFFARALASRTELGDIKDGSSNTMLVGEAEQDDRNTNPDVCCFIGTPPGDASVKLMRHAFFMEGDHHSMRSTEFPPFASIGECVSLLNPMPWTQCNYTFGSPHVGVVHLVMCDGSVRAIGENIDGKPWQCLGPINDGGVLGEL
jgi:type II secretory pathway pseudopilin PulG